jgi:hypothetical protein
LTDLPETRPSALKNVNTDDFSLHGMEGKLAGG